ncbi:DUF4282 domain-containing protein [Calidifontibacter terrae]
MSQPTNGGYEGPDNSLGREFGNQQSQGGSLGSEYNSSWDQGESSEQQTQQFSQSGQQGSYEQPSASPYGQPQGQPQGQQGTPSYDQGQQGPSSYDQGGDSPYGQPQGQQGGYGQQPGYQSQAPAKTSQPSVFSDTKFEHSLTPKIASLTFLLVSVAAVLWGLTDIIHAFVGDGWSGQGAGDVTVKMKVFPAILNLLADVAIVGAIIFGARLLIELAVNVAKNTAAKSSD